MKKFLLLLLAAATFTACNEDEGIAKIRYATSNDAIIDGRLTGTNMHFYGRSVVTDDKGGTYTDDKAYFEFAGGAEQLTVYMHQTRFDADMPGLEMRIPNAPYTGSGNSVAFSEQRIVPEILIGSTGGYQPMPSYTLTDVVGSIDGLQCRVSFTCNVPKLGVYQMQYEGKLIIKD